jgi:hypothetical protein
MAIQHSDLIAGAGTVMTCPQCHAKIGTLRKPLYQGWTFGLDIVKFFAGMQPEKDHPSANCRKCGAAYSEMLKSLTGVRKTWIHTEHGWLPPEKTAIAHAVGGLVDRVQG